MPRNQNPEIEYGLPAARAPNGRGLCRFCGLETRWPRRTFCSDECVEAWKLRSGDSAYLRRLVFRRDLARCQLCGAEGGMLEVDHIVPISEGGTNDLTNLRTLCRGCHARETGLLRRRLNARQRGQAMMPIPYGSFALPLVS